MGSWKEDEKDRSIGTLAINLIELKEALLSRIEAMETALWEAKSTASHDAQQGAGRLSWLACSTSCR